MGGHDHSHSHGQTDDHSEGVYKGLGAIIGIYVFFVIEKVMQMRRARKEKRVSFLSLFISYTLTIYSSILSRGFFLIFVKMIDGETRISLFQVDFRNSLKFNMLKSNLIIQFFVIIFRLIWFDLIVVWRCLISWMNFQITHASISYIYQYIFI